MSTARTMKKQPAIPADADFEGPSAESLAEMPEVDFSKGKRVVRRLKGKERYTLAMLRKSAGLTQIDVASAAEIAQSEVARVEAREDMLVSSLRRYTEAIGGKLEVAVVLNGRRYVLAIGHV